jgi:hypothetical protein
MSISITDPPANQVVGGSFTAQGNYYCPVGGPTFQCSISPAPTGKRVSPVAAKTPAMYVTAGSSTWEAYFSGVPAGNYTVNASISHTGSIVNAAPVNISVSATPPVTISSPQQGDTISTGGCSVTGTVGSAYISGYTVICSLTGNGLVGGGPVGADPDQSGNWSVNLPVPQGLSGNTNMNVNVNLVAPATNASACEAAVGSLTIQ